MSYKYSKGASVQGDIKAADDTQRDTLIDFGEDRIDFQTSGSVRLQVNNDGVFIPDTPADYSLKVSGAIEITPGHNAGITFKKTESELNFIKFANASDGTSYNAYLAYQVSEHLYISPGRGADFYINSRTNVGSDPTTFPFRIMDDGTARFEKNLSDGNASANSLASNISFYVSGTRDGSNDAVFVGDVIMSGSLKVNQQVSTNALSVKVRDVGATGDIEATDYILRCIQNASITLTLPPKNVSVGRVLIFKDALGKAGSPNNNTITIDGNGSDTIDGAGTYVISRNKEGIHFICDGVNGWMMTSRVRP